MSLFNRLPSTSALFWEQNQTFVTPYTLQECLTQLQSLGRDSSLSNMKLEWIENDPSQTGNALRFTCDNRRSRITVGLVGRIEAQNAASYLVRAKVGIYYSNVYFFLAIVLIAPIFMSSGTQPNLLGSYFVSLLGHYAVMLVVAFVFVQVLGLAFESAQHQMMNDLKVVLKGSA